MKLKELADVVGGRIAGDPDVDITGVSGIREAGEGRITYLADEKHLDELLKSGASAAIVKEKIKGFRASMLIVDNPQYIFAKTLEVFHARPFAASGVSDKAVIGENVKITGEISICPFACISDNVSLGPRVTIGQGVFIGEGVSIGGDAVIYPNVTIREKVTIGSRVTIQSGSVIGSDGFGYVLEKGMHYKIPQVGGVVIEDDVEIGANVTIDRATVGNTHIGSGTKIDNLVQIAHNVKIGKNCIIVAQAGISGSVEIGDGVILGGQVGVRDHVKVGGGAVVASQAGIVRDIPGGKVYSGSPALPHNISLRASSIYSKLPELMKRLREIEKKIKIDIH